MCALPFFFFFFFFYDKMFLSLEVVSILFKY